MNLKGSKTEKNLFKTFAGESRVRNKYTFYAEKARDEGFMYIANVFEETAGNEMAHAREVYRRFLDRVNNTKNNLIESALGESEENKVIYKEFEEIAREEGFEEIADFYKELQEVEGHHKERFLALAKRVKDGKMFKLDRESEWLCLNCGYIYEGKEAPMRCPLCRYPRSYFKKNDDEDCK
ncbi:rubrerythrin family protein [Clostridium chromiireducens]|uniref:Rubrerythrin n=1 Tax=Clostridium chromiireducens TaxID=225345 RepID=A0A1V4IQH9_9CLOT|nr:rubrerythrin family protein [Clostridium chromiireducens]OPJ61737.1 rubrerythrin [Clostridium chromiireducens]RII32186.1 rubrerythrin family protein [Clostridium chromiireducens]